MYYLCMSFPGSLDYWMVGEAGQSIPSLPDSVPQVPSCDHWILTT